MPTVTLSDDVYNLVIVTSTVDLVTEESYAYLICDEYNAKTQFVNMCMAWGVLSDTELTEALKVGWYSNDAGVIHMHYSKL